MFSSTNYAIAHSPCPIFNTAESPFAKPILELDSQDRIFAMETIAFPLTRFIVHEHLPNNVYRVTTEEYTTKIPIYVDSRCLSFCNTEPPPRKIPALNATTILNNLMATLGTRYFWGGTYPNGIEHMKNFYPHHTRLNENAQCVGVDCSGLLRYATGGLTPHSTMQLLKMGELFAPSTLDAQSISNLAKPLDLIVWPGHVIIVIDKTTVIESALGKGVFCSPLEQRLEEVRVKIQAEGKQLSYQRWFNKSVSTR